MPVFPRIRRTSDDPPPAVESTSLAPHCDQWVLHAPGVCPACDNFPSRQADRIRNRVLFTGDDPRPGWEPCPATVARPVEQIERWPGNTPAGYDNTWQHVGSTASGGEVFIAKTGTPAPTITLEFDATPELVRLVSGGALTSVSLAPLPDIADWLHTQIDADIAELTATCRTAGVSLAAGANAWPDVRRQLGWADAMRDLVDLHAPAVDSDRCPRCGTGDPWGSAAPHPCLTLRVLAVAYADRPGYLEQWAVDA